MSITFFSLFSFFQTKSLVGVVSDDSNNPLESANVIAKLAQEKADLKFAIADNKGRYRLELDKEMKYEITVSYIGFVDEVFFLEPNSAPLYTKRIKRIKTGLRTGNPR
ncbi:MAG: carboxypeptidase-like regulatory domain-containing protein [Bacteroidota bacterium]